MNFFWLLKILLSAVIIALASELARKSSFFAAVTLALPLTSILTLIWVHYDSGDKSRIAALSWNVFWLVPPSLAFFPLFATLISKDFSFWLAFLLAATLTAAVYIAYSRILSIFGIHL